MLLGLVDGGGHQSAGGAVKDGDGDGLGGDSGRLASARSTRSGGALVDGDHSRLVCACSADLGDGGTSAAGSDTSRNSRDGADGGVGHNNFLFFQLA